MGISQQQALDCFASDDLIGIGMEADSVRRSLHPDGIVTYAVDRTFALTNDHLTLFGEIASALSEGVATIRIASATAGLGELESLLKSLQAHFPSIKIQSLSAAEVTAMAVASKLSEGEVLARLRGAGLEAIDGSIAGISPEHWLAVHAAAHHAGLRSQASLEFGATVGVDALVGHWMALRALQEETAGFTSLSLHAFQSSGERAEFEKPTAVEYLRTLAIARMVIDNIPNIESNSVDEGLKVMQMALRFGANDGGTIASSAKASFTESDLRRVVRDAGFTPVERDMLYRAMFLNN